MNCASAAFPLPIAELPIAHCPLPNRSSLFPTSLSFGMTDSLLLSHRDGPCLTLTLNRPDRRNALSRALVEVLQAELDRAAMDESLRAVVLTGAGTAFSAGADLDALRAMQTATTLDNLDDSAALARLFETIYTHPKPVVAKVNGAAIGGGCGLAAVCDFSFVAEEAKLGFPEVRLGFVPAIVMLFVPGKVGEARARDLLLRGALLSGSEAAAMGLVTRSVPAERLDAEVDELVRELATETSGSAVALTKSLLARLGGMGFAEALGHAVQTNALARTTPDFRAGIEAFLGRTAPPWKAPQS